MTTDIEPFVGPRPFQRAESELFFGRDSEARDLAALVIAHPVVLFYAASGAGKSSLVNARVVALLEAEGFDIQPVVRLGGLLPEGIDVAKVKNIFVFNILLGWQPDAAQASALVNARLQQYLEQAGRKADEDGEPAPRLVVFDQLEEIFTAYLERWPDRKNFFLQIREALDADPLLRVLLVIREDFLASLDPFETLLPEKFRARLRLETLRRPAALAAMNGPLRHTGGHFEEGVAESLVDQLSRIRTETPGGETIEVAGEFVEPVQLQVVCQSLWRERGRTTKTIRMRDLKGFNVERALAQFYDEAIAAAAEAADISAYFVRDWCEENLITSTGTRDFVHRDRDSTGGLPNLALDILEDHHLIRSEWRAGARWYELTHDKFLSAIRAANEHWAKQREKIQEGIASGLRQAEAKLRETRYDDALKTANKIADDAREIFDVVNYIGALQIIGESLKAIGNPDEALDAYHQALELAQQIQDPYLLSTTLLAIGHFLHESEAFEEARAYFDIHIQLFPEDHQGYSGRAATLWYEGQAPEAEAGYSDALDRCPRADASAIYNGRGQVRAELGMAEKALDDLDQALELTDNPVAKSYARNGRALALGLLDRFDDALAEFRMALRISRDNAWAYYNRAQVYQRMGRVAEAETDLRKALKKQAPPLNPVRRKTAEAQLRKLTAR